MKTLILLGTVKKDGLSNTETLSLFFSQKLSEKDIECEILKLIDYNILPGTYRDMGPQDAWPEIHNKILASEIIIFATPIWWGNHSSEIQRVIERLDAIHDEILQGEQSSLEGKLGGIIITGDSDGAQHVIASIANFFNALGILFPPYCTLSVLWEGQRKGAETTREELLEKFEKDYAKTAEIMIAQFNKFLGV